MKPFSVALALAAAGALLFASEFDGGPGERVGVVGGAIESDALETEAPSLVELSCEAEVEERECLRDAETDLEGADVLPSQVELALAASKDLNEQVGNALDGIVEVNRIVEKMLVIAALPTEKHVDLSFPEGEDGFAFRFAGLPKGVNAHLIAGAPVFRRAGKEFHQVELLYQDIRKGVDFYRGAARTGPKVRVGVDYDTDGNPGFIHITAQRAVSVRSSIDAGVDARSGEFTNGLMFQANLSDPLENYTRTFGLLNGAHASDVSSPKLQSVVKPLDGDIHVEPANAVALFEKLRGHFSSLKGEDQ